MLQKEKLSEQQKEQKIKNALNDRETGEAK